MIHISGFERSQLLLLPGAIDDYVDPENPVRFIDAFVDELDLAAAGFARVTPEKTGRPGYAPGDLLKLGRLKHEVQHRVILSVGVLYGQGIQAVIC
jgi:transposase